MSIPICTIFENEYHYGAAGLINSLVLHGYKGTIYGAYRGKLPEWGALGQKSHLSGFSDVVRWQVAPDVEVCLIAVDPDRHLANYKAPFMLQLFEAVEEMDGLFYLDSDICVNARWDYFEEWIECGVALCEDVSSPFSEFHPRRVGWRNYYRESGVELRFKFAEYINSGAVGVTRRHIEFLENWEKLQQLMAPIIGGLDQSVVGGGTSEKMRDSLFCFRASDQDALNATIEAHDCPYSVQNKSAMITTAGVNILPHAFGTLKPWDTQYLKRAMKGSPRLVDKVYWHSLQQGPIKPFPRRKIDQQVKMLRAARILSKIVRGG